MVDKKIAVISGGSSGIGLSCAKVLLSRGYHVILLARDEEKLTKARISLGLAESMVLDVTNLGATKQAIAEILRTHGRIDWLVTCAGMIEPGMFSALDMESHHRQMDVNYFGTLNLVHPVAEGMIRQRSGRITMISSGAAFVGIVGFSGYAPGKFAVRALGEVLRVELAQFGISVSVVFPADTDTPQLAQENLSKPAPSKEITAGGGIWSPDFVADRILSQAEAGRFMLTNSALMTLFGWFHSLYAPFFRRRQKNILRRHQETEL